MPKGNIKQTILLAKAKYHDYEFINVDYQGAGHIMQLLNGNKKKKLSRQPDRDK